MLFRSRRESAKSVSVDDRHVSAPWGSTTMEIALGPKTVSNSPRNGQESAKTASVGTPGFKNHGNRFGTPILSNSPRNGSEWTKTASVDDRHVSAPWGSTTMEIALGPQNSDNSPRNGSELTKTTSVDHRHLNAPRGLLIMEITPRPNSE